VSSVESLVVDVVRLAADVDQGVVEELRNGDAVGNVSVVPTLIVARVGGNGKVDVYTLTPRS